MWLIFDGREEAIEEKVVSPHAFGTRRLKVHNTEMISIYYVAHRQALPNSQISVNWTVFFPHFLFMTVALYVYRGIAT